MEQIKQETDSTEEDFQEFCNMMKVDEDDDNPLRQTMLNESNEVASKLIKQEVQVRERSERAKGKSKQ